MSTTRDQQPAPGGSEGARVEKLYERYGGALKHVIMRSFGLDSEDAEAVLEETLQASLTRPDPYDVNCFIAAVCRHASTRSDASEPTEQEIEALRKEILLRPAIEGLTPDAHEAVRMRIVEECTFEQIAERLGVSVRYARRLVVGAVQKLRGEAGRPR